MTAADVHDEALQDREVRAAYERSALAHDVAMKVLQYRAEHKMSQSALARKLGMQQPAISRIEAGDHEPSLSTLSRLADGLGLQFHIALMPQGSAVAAGSEGVAELAAEVAALRNQMTELREAVERLSEQTRSVEMAIGSPEAGLGSAEAVPVEDLIAALRASVEAAKGRAADKTSGHRAGNKTSERSAI